MKITPVNYEQKFCSKKNQNPSERRFGVSSAILIPVLIGGLGFATFDQGDYYESKKELANNNILMVPEREYENLLEKIAINDLKINKTGENKFIFSADTKGFDKLSGTIEKTEIPWLTKGSFKKEGLFNTEEFHYEFRELSQKARDNRYKLILDLWKEKTIVEKDDNGNIATKIVKYDKQRHSLRKNNESNEIYLDGESMNSRESRNMSVVGPILFILTLAGGYNIARKK